MRITIAERLRPFSHNPGTSFVLPGSSLSLQIFPALIRIKDLAAETKINAEIALNLEGPIRDFTSLLDLENGSLRVWGESKVGYFRYAVKALALDQGLEIALEKSPKNGILFTSCGKWTIRQNSPLLPGEKLTLAEHPSENATTISFFSSIERLSLGSHKLQDWELIKRRLEFSDIFPIWHRLGKAVSETSVQKLSGTALLLDECQNAIAANAPEKILEKFLELFLAGFEGILSPRLVDADFQGIKYQGIDLSTMADSHISSLLLLTEGARLIRSLFIQEGYQTLHILPALPPKFHCGRFLDINCAKQGSLSIEWTKKSIRRMTFSAQQNQVVAFSFSNHEKKCRLRNSHKDKGLAYIPGDQIDIFAGQSYWFDNFER